MTDIYIRFTPKVCAHDAWQQDLLLGGVRDHPASGDELHPPPIFHGWETIAVHEPEPLRELASNHGIGGVAGVEHGLAAACTNT